MIAHTDGTGIILDVLFILLRIHSYTYLYMMQKNYEIAYIFNCRVSLKYHSKFNMIQDCKTSSMHFYFKYCDWLDKNRKDCIFHHFPVNKAYKYLEKQSKTNVSLGKLFRTAVK